MAAMKVPLSPMARHSRQQHWETDDDHATDPTPRHHDGHCRHRAGAAAGRRPERDTDAASGRIPSPWRSSPIR